MNQHRFEVFQRAAQDQFLEESQVPKKTHWRTIGALAACFGVVVLSLSAWRLHTGNAQPAAQLANPIQESSAAELQSLGYQMAIPADAENVSYTTIAVSQESSTPMAQICYESDRQAYTLRALKTEESADISGISADWSDDLSWTSGDAELRLCSNDTEAWVGWYSQAEETQWCLSSTGSGETLLDNAFSLARDLGIDFSTAPDGAEEVTVRAWAQDGLTIAETQFVYGGVLYAYRTAATQEVTLTDISGQEAAYTQSEQTTVSYCEAELDLTADGQGKILWLDVVPGLVYSLSAEAGTSAQQLTNLANDLFVPAQGDVG